MYGSILCHGGNCELNVNSKTQEKKKKEEEKIIPRRYLFHY
jgi:hypothetical protein